MSRNSKIVLCVVLLLFMSSASFAEAREPEAFTYDTNYSETGERDVIIRGHVLPYFSPDTVRWFEWGQTSALGNRTPEEQNHTDAEDYWYLLSGLSSDTVYYFRASARNAEGTARGPIKSFRTRGADNAPLVVLPTSPLSTSNTTPSSSSGGSGGSVFFSTSNTLFDYAPPVVVTYLPTGLTSTSVRLGGLALPGGQVSTFGWFEWGQNTFLNSQTFRQNFGVVSERSREYSTILSNLTPQTKYYYRAVVQTSQGVAYGAVLSFVTPPLFSSPVVIAQPTPTQQPTPTLAQVTSGTAITALSQKTAEGAGRTFSYVFVDDQARAPQERYVASESLSQSDFFSLATFPNDKNISYREPEVFTVYYENMSGVELSDVVFRVILPEELQLKDGTQGILNMGSVLLYEVPSVPARANGAFSYRVAPKTDSLRRDKKLETIVVASWDRVGAKMREDVVVRSIVTPNLLEVSSRVAISDPAISDPRVGISKEGVRDLGAVLGAVSDPKTGENQKRGFLGFFPWILFSIALFVILILFQKLIESKKESGGGGKSANTDAFGNAKASTLSGGVKDQGDSQHGESDEQKVPQILRDWAYRPRDKKNAPFYAKGQDVPPLNLPI